MEHKKIKNRLSDISSERLMMISALVFVLGLGFYIIKKRFFDSDDWFILTTGKYILENGFPYTNPFTLHENLDIVVQQWLFDIVMYSVYAVLGNFGLLLFNFICFIAFCFLLYVLTGYWAKELSKRSVLFLCGTLTAFLVWAGRPTTITLSVICLELIVMERWKLNKRFTTLLPLIPIALFEVNVHAAFYPILFVLMLPYCIPEKISWHIPDVIKRINWKMFLIWPFMILVGLINPYGIKGACYLFLSYGTAASENFIAELQAPSTTTVYGLFVIMGAVVLVLYVYNKRSAISGTRFCMAAGTLILACIHIRNIWFLIFGILPLLSCLLPSGTPNKRNLLQVFATCCTVACIWFVQSLNFSLDIADSMTAPISVADYLDSYEGDIVLYTGFNNGAYMEWRGYQTYIDARPELYGEKINGTKDVYSEFLEVRSGSIDYDDFIEEYGFTHCLVIDDGCFDVYLQYNDDYTLVVDGDGYNLYEKSAAQEE